MNQLHSKVKEQGGSSLTDSPAMLGQLTVLATSGAMVLALLCRVGTQHKPQVLLEHILSPLELLTSSMGLCRDRSARIALH